MSAAVMFPGTWSKGITSSRDQRGGPTTMENLQVLCIACNRRKGIREGVAEGKTPAAVAMGTAPLRRWQERARRPSSRPSRARAHRRLPRCRKTRFALEYAARLSRARR